MVAYLSGAPERIGYATYHRQYLLTKYAVEPLEKNLVDRYLDLLTLNGLTVRSNQIELFLADDEIKAAQELLASVFPGSKRLVVALAPFAADMRRTWGVEAFAQLADRAVAQGYAVTVLGAQGDRQHLPSSLEDRPGVVNLVGKLGIRETAAVIGSSAAFVGNDSGLAHVAGAMGTRGIVLGYHVTKVWYPSAASITSIIRDPGCSSCDISSCATRHPGRLPCFAAITVDEVVEALQGCLRERING
jgi:ADP-heptose:LPS heptosyltransferase